jgi:hypothetical protein
MIEDLLRDITFNKALLGLAGVSFVYYWVVSILVNREIYSLGGRAPRVFYYLPYGKFSLHIHFLSSTSFK